MPGCRRLTDNEIVSMLQALETPRDKCLFILGLFSGFRISELLSLHVSDVIENGSLKDRINVRRKDMKGKIKGRSVVMHPNSKPFILEAIQGLSLDSPLFPSRKGSGPLTRHGAHAILKLAYKKANIRGKVATHTMRKTFANKVFEKLNRDLYKTMRALGHDRSENTVRYLEIDQPEIDAAIISI